MLDEIEKIVISSLLHDIGKIVQRSKGEEAKLKRHQEWGAEWIENTFSELPYEDKIYLLNAVKYHHWLKETDYKVNELSIHKEPQRKIWFNWLVYEADNLAAGERGEKTESYLKEEKIFEKYIPLTSLFWKIRFDEKSRKDYIYHDTPWVYPLKFLDEKIVYPEPFNESRNYLTPSDYEKILKAFTSSLKKVLKEGKFNSNSILPLMEKYFSFIPSETEITPDKYYYPDVSLYDHLKITSAIALCIYHFLEENYKEEWKIIPEKFVLNRKENRFLLIGGDISGIQDFIYTITSKNALKSLRGRSFYLQILTEHVVREIIKFPSLVNANVIYKGGGSFLILAPNTKKAKNKIKEIDENINSYLFESFNGKLFFAIDYIELNGESFIVSEGSETKIGEKWRELNSKLQNKKRKKFYNILTKENFEPMEIGERECEICKKADKKTGFKIFKEDTEELILCSDCYSFVKAGEILKETTCILIQENFEKNHEFGFKIDKKLYSFHKEIPEKYEGEILILNKFIEGYETLWIANYSSKEKSFENIVKKGDGAEYLGSLRMDVDNLGDVLFKYLPLEMRTFSRIASLSRLINLFFSVYINRISMGFLDDLKDENGIIIKPLRLNKKKQDEQENKNIEREIVMIYSGGDDLFIAGAWNDCLEIAIDIKRAFSKFTCENPDIGISGGFIVTSPHSPVYHFSETTGKAEDEAKKHFDEFNRKDKFCIFYSPVEKKQYSLKMG